LWEFLEGKSTQAQSCQGFSLLQIEDIAVIGENPHIKPIPLYTFSRNIALVKRSKSTEQ
jgi:hypothetical protein